MKKLLLLLSFSAFTAGAANVSFNFTNSATGLPDTNSFRVIPIDNYVESGGGFIVKGPPVRLTPKPDGRITNSFPQGNYLVTNSAVSQGFLIRVPLDSGATIYNATAGTDNGGLALSGFNRFVTIQYGTNLPPTFDEVTNALQLLPVSANQVTNTANDIGSRITNGFTPLVYTNVSQVLYTNYLPALTNVFVTSSVTNGLATTNYVDAAVAAGGGGAASTNGLATTNYVHAQGFVTSSVTNGLATTNYVHGQGFVTSSVTNGLAPLTFMTNYVTTRGYVTSSVTNGLATTNYVHGQGFVTSSVTNGLATTNYVNAIANTNGINVAPGNTFVSMVTNAGLVTISGVNQTNGMYRSRWTTNSDSTSIDGSTLINVMATNVSAPITNRWRVDITNAIDANMLAPDLLTLYTNAGQVFVNTTMIVATNSSRALWFTNANNLIAGTLTNGSNRGNPFSSPGALLGSEQFGSGAVADAINSTAIGKNAAAGGQSSTAIGQGSSAGASARESDTAIGQSAEADGGNASAIGGAAQAIATNAVAIGSSAVASGTNAVAIGGQSQSAYSNSIAIGFGVQTIAQDEIHIGGPAHWVNFPGNATIAGTFTNGTITTTNISLGARSLFSQNTNIIEVIGAGSSIANGLYYRNAGWWTNSAGAYLTNISGVHYIYSNAVTLYSSVGLENATWTQVSGALPVPASYKGTYVPGASLFVTGLFAPTNLLQIINAPTNSASDSYIISATGGNTKWIANPNAPELYLASTNASAYALNIISGNAAGLTNYPLASRTVPGITATNDYILSQSTPGWQEEMDRLPYLGQTADVETSLTNMIQFHKDVGRFGYNIFASFSGGSSGIYHGARVGGHLVFNTTNFPSGSTGLRSLLHTNGWRWMVWYDRNNVAGGTPTVAQFIDDLQTIVSWMPDIIWADETDAYYMALAAQILATNATPIQLMTAGLGASGANFITFPQTIARGSHWRIHGSSDVTSWNALKEYADIIETNGASFAGAGHPFYVGPEVSTLTGAAANTAAALQAMWSSDIIEAFCNNSVNTYGRYQILTNTHILEVQSDPALVCARRVMITNGCWIYLKPLGTPIGPNYAILVINTNTSATAVSFSFADLTKGLQPSGSTFRGNNNNGTYNFLVYNLKSDAVEGFQSTITTSSIATQDYAFYKLVAPSTAQPQHYFVRVMPSSDAATGWTENTWNAYSGPFNPGGNTYARSGWHTTMDATKRVNIDVPDTATRVIVRYQISSTGSFSLTNTPNALRYDPSSGMVTDTAGNATVTSMVNGIQTITFSSIFKPDTVGQGKLIVDTWAAGTDTNVVNILSTSITVE